MLKWLRRAIAGRADVVVVGEGARAESIARGARAGGYNVSRAAVPARDAGATVLSGRDEAADLETARTFAAAWQPAPNAIPAETILAVACESGATLTALQDLDANTTSGLRVRPLSASATMARRLLLEHSFARLQSADGQPFIVGTGAEAEQVLMQLFRMMHLPGVKPRAAILGPDAPSWIARLGKDIPGLAVSGTVTAASALVSPSAVYVADARVWESLTPPQWFVPVYWLPGAGRPAPAGAIAVPQIDWQAAIATLFRDPADLQARAIHELYLEERRLAGEVLGSRPSMQPWEILPERFRAASRHQADHIGCKLAAIACHAVEERSEQRFAFSPDELEMLSEVEHRRWAAVQLLDGWQYGETRDDRAKRTPLLVDYESLTPEIRDLDRLSVRAVPAQLARAQRVVLRDLRIRFTAKSDPAIGFALNFKRLLDELATRYEDREPVLITRLAGPMEYLAARTAVETGKARLQVVLDVGVDATPETMALAAIAEKLSSTVEGPFDVVVVGEADQTTDCGSARVIAIDEAGVVRAAPWL